VPVIDYSARDFDSIKTAVLAHIKSTYPNDWTDFYESNIGMALLELVAYVGSSLHFMIDLVANEMFVETAQDRISMIRLCQLIGYKLSPPTAASVNLTATIEEIQYSDVTIPAGTVVTSTTGVTFEILDEYTIEAGQTSASVVATCGVTKSDTFSSDGTAFQKFTLNNSGDIAGSISVSVDGDDWSEEDSLVAGGETSEIYTIDHDQDDYAILGFGDNTNGAIPPTGAVITVSYRVNGGVQGNIGVRKINQVVNGVLEGSVPVEYVSVTLLNLSRGSGGEDRETVDHARYWGPRSVKTNGRAVTAEDFETLATLFSDSTYGSPAYASARLKQQVPELNTVMLYLWSRDSDGNPIPAGTSLMSAVDDYFSNNEEGAVRLICVDTEVAAGVCLYLDIDVSVAADTDYSASDVNAAVDTAISSLFSSSSILPGRDFRVSLLYSAMQGVTGVDHTIVNSLTASLQNTESLGTGTGVAQTVTGTLEQVPLADSITITAGTLTVTDDGDGSLVGDGTGTIDYETGAYSLTITAGNGDDISCLYRYVTTYDRSGTEQTMDGSTAQMKGTLSYAPIEPSSLAFAAGDQVVVDDGSGSFTGDCYSGTIDYSSGAYVVTWSATPMGGTVIYSAYCQVLDSSSHDVPVLKSQLAVAGNITVSTLSEEDTD